MEPLPQIIELELKPRHFEGTSYIEADDCAISKAFKELYPGEIPYTDSSSVDVGGVLNPKAIYEIERGYGPSEFKQDKAIAEITISSEEVIRTVTLVKL